MSDAYPSAITLPEETTGAINELKSRGIRFRDRGLRVLGYAGAAAVLAVGAFLLGYPISEIDLPVFRPGVRRIQNRVL